MMPARLVSLEHYTTVTEETVTESLAAYAPKPPGFCY